MTTLSNGCVIGATCSVNTKEVLEDRTVIYGENCARRKMAENPPNHDHQSDFLKKILPNYHHFVKPKLMRPWTQEGVYCLYRDFLLFLHLFLIFLVPVSCSKLCAPRLFTSSCLFCLSYINITISKYYTCSGDVFFAFKLNFLANKVNFIKIILKVRSKFAKQRYAWNYATLII